MLKGFNATVDFLSCLPSSLCAICMYHRRERFQWSLLDLFISYLIGSINTEKLIFKEVWVPELFIYSQDSLLKNTVILACRLPDVVFLSLCLSWMMTLSLLCNAIAQPSLHHTRLDYSIFNEIRLKLFYKLIIFLNISCFYNYLGNKKKKNFWLANVCL